MWVLRCVPTLYRGATVTLVLNSVRWLRRGSRALGVRILQLQCIGDSLWPYERVMRGCSQTPEGEAPAPLGRWGLSLHVGQLHYVHYRMHQFRGRGNVFERTQTSWGGMASGPLGKRVKRYEASGPPGDHADARMPHLQAVMGSHNRTWWEAHRLTSQHPTYHHLGVDCGL